MLNILVDNIQKSQLSEHQAEYFELSRSLLKDQDNHIKFEAHKAYLKLIKVMKDSTFFTSWREIFNTTWGVVLDSKPYIEVLGGAPDLANFDHLEEIEEVKENIKVEEIKLELAETKKPSCYEGQDEYLELVHQTGFDLLSYLSARVSFDTDEQEGWVQKFIEPIFDHLDGENWSCVRFAKFVLILLICNGGANQLINVGDMMNENVQGRFMRFVMDKQYELIDFGVLETVTSKIIKSIEHELGHTAGGSIYSGVAHTFTEQQLAA